MFKYLIFEILSALLGVVAVLFLLFHFYKNKNVKNTLKLPSVYMPVFLFVFAFFTGMLSNRTYPPNFAMPAWMHSHAPGELPASIPFGKILEFMGKSDRFQKVENIGADPNTVPELSLPDSDGVVRISMTAKEVIAPISEGIYFNYWTYDGTAPGPMLRVREGDTIELALSNDPSSLHHHNIDLHAVTGPGGGASLTHVAPGETKTFRWKALNPGLYIYHCAMPNVSTHNSHGQYGLILVEPKEGLEKVDKEFYLVQGELYTIGKLGKKGLVPFDSEDLLEGVPNYVVFNGMIEDAPRMKAKVGDKIRIYVGNGGVNLISSFHLIGEIFDKVYPEGAIGKDSAVFENVQTTAVLPGGSAIVEFTLDVPGKFLFVDHALARMNKGAWAVLEVEGKENPDIFSQVNK